jgi:hypothetical protein
MSSDLRVDTLPPTRRQPGPLLGVRVLRVLLWLLVATGPVAAGVGMVQVSDLADRVDAFSRQTPAEIQADTSPVEGFAELFLASHLTKRTEEPRASHADEEGRLVARTVSLGAEQIDDGYHAVTVAAVVRVDPEPVDDAASGAASTLIYVVGVVETDSGLAVVGPPALIPAPGESLAPDLAVDRMTGLDAGLEEATVRFLSAYLAGDGELARYTAPGSQLTPILPPPFVSVEVFEAGSVSVGDNTNEVVAVVEGFDGSGRVQVLQFGLVMGQRDGRWEVVEVLAAPTLVGGDQ